MLGSEGHQLLHLGLYLAAHGCLLGIELVSGRLDVLNQVVELVVIVAIVHNLPNLVGR